MKILSYIFKDVTKTTVMAMFVSSVMLTLTGTILGQDRSETKSSAKFAEQNDALSAFLAAPIDLITFKKKKGPSNSGSFKGTTWIYRPKEQGFFYRYMLFNTPTHYNEGERFDGFTVVVYKFGEEIGDYYDSNEALIAIWCRLRDPDLGEADLVGRSVSEIKGRFGRPFVVVGDILIYHHHGRALSVHTINGIVDWFKYVRLSHDIDNPKVLPKLLLQPGLRG